MRVPQIDQDEAYLLGLLLAECDEHIGSVFSYRDLETESFSMLQIKKAARSLNELGLVSSSTIASPDNPRKSDPMLMLTPRGLLLCLEREAEILKAMMSGGSVSHLNRVREAFDRFQLNSGSTFQWTDVSPPLDESDKGPIVVHSSAWTGRTLSATDRLELARNIDQALRKIDELELSQEKRAQARAFLRAVRELAEAPDPPFDLIEFLLKNVDRIIGIAGLFVGIAGFLVAL